MSGVLSLDVPGGGSVCGINLVLGRPMGSPTLFTGLAPTASFSGSLSVPAGGHVSLLRFTDNPEQLDLLDDAGGGGWDAGVHRFGAGPLTSSFFFEGRPIRGISGSLGIRIDPSAMMGPGQFRFDFPLDLSSEQLVAVPEPESAGLLLLGLIGSCLLLSPRP